MCILVSDSSWYFSWVEIQRTALQLCNWQRLGLNLNDLICSQASAYSTKHSQMAPLTSPQLARLPQTKTFFSANKREKLLAVMDQNQHPGHLRFLPCWVGNHQMLGTQFWPPNDKTSRGTGQKGSPTCSSSPCWPWPATACQSNASKSNASAMDMGSHPRAEISEAPKSPWSTPAVWCGLMRSDAVCSLTGTKKMMSLGRYTGVWTNIKITQNYSRHLRVRTQCNVIPCDVIWCDVM